MTQSTDILCGRTWKFALRFQVVELGGRCCLVPGEDVGKMFLLCDGIVARLLVDLGELLLELLADDFIPLSGIH